ncbi:MAG: hypothetical protein ABIJ08_07455, partial [Nanoarchaeota archaeon]
MGLFSKSSKKNVMDQIGRLDDVVLQLKSVYGHNVRRDDGSEISIRKFLESTASPREALEVLGDGLRHVRDDYISEIGTAQDMDLVKKVLSFELGRQQVMDRLAVMLDSKDYADMITLGNERLKDGRFDDALVAFTNALQTSEDKGAALYGKGRVFEAK